MSKYPPQKPKKTTSSSLYFDKATLTTTDLALLQTFYSRRADFEFFLVQHRLLYNKHCCPACAFPSLAVSADYQTCLICLWEDSGLDDAQDTLVTAPNYISLVEARINITQKIQQFTAAYRLAASCEEQLQSISRFETLVREGKAVIDAVDFNTHLKNIFQ